MRIPSIAFIALIFLMFNGCSKKPQNTGSTVDQGMRRFFGIESVQGSCPVLKQDKCFRIAVLKFHDGKLIGQDGGGGMGREILIQQGKIHLEFLWGERNGKMTALLVQGVSGIEEDPFFSNFTKNYGTSNQFFQPQKYKDWKILAYGETTGLGGKHVPMVGDFSTTLRLCEKEKQDAFALVFQSFPTEKALEKAMYSK